VVTERYWRVDGHETAVALDGIAPTPTPTRRAPMVPPHRRLHVMRGVAVAGLAVAGVIVITAIRGGPDERPSNRADLEASDAGAALAQRQGREGVAAQPDGGREPSSAQRVDDRPRHEQSPNTPAPTPDPLRPESAPLGPTEAPEPVPTQMPVETPSPEPEPVPAAQAPASDFSFGAG
jgi:hypothetical protein